MHGLYQPISTALCLPSIKNLTFYTSESHHLFWERQVDSEMHTHTHTRLMALFPGLPRWAGTRKVKTNLDFTEARDSGISWAICKSAPSSRQITMPAPHHSVFLQAGCPSCRPTNSVKALKAEIQTEFNPKILFPVNRAALVKGQCIMYNEAISGRHNMVMLVTAPCHLYTSRPIYKISYDNLMIILR